MKPIPTTIISKESTATFINTLKSKEQEHTFILCSNSVYKYHGRKLFNTFKGKITTYQHGEPNSLSIWHYKKMISPSTKILIAIGGGSVIDTIKLISLKYKSVEELDQILFNKKDKVKMPNVKIVAIPTTCGTGSEVTSIAVAADSQGMMKWAVVTDDILPNVAILDASLLAGIPQKQYAHSTADALTHAIESYLSPKSTPASEEISISALNILLKNYSSGLNPHKDDITIFEKMLYASYLAGCSLNSAGVGAVHALSYPIGAELHIPHGLANGVLLPHVLKFNLKVNSPKTKELKKILSLHLHEKTDLSPALEKLLERNGVKLHLKKYGVTLKQLRNYAEKAFEVKRLMNNNIYHLTIEEIENIYKEIY